MSDCWSELQVAENKVRNLTAELAAAKTALDEMSAAFGRVEQLRTAALNESSRLAAALEVAAATLHRFSWEGSSVNYPARQALAKIRELGFEELYARIVGEVLAASKVEGEAFRAALAAGRGLDNDDDNLATWRAERDDGRGTGE